MKWDRKRRHPWYFSKSFALDFPAILDPSFSPQTISAIYFNCSEGTQRLCVEHCVSRSLASLEHIFLTQKSWRCMGGLALVECVSLSKTLDLQTTHTDSTLTVEYLHLSKNNPTHNTQSVPAPEYWNTVYKGFDANGKLISKFVPEEIEYDEKWRKGKLKQDYMDSLLCAPIWDSIRKEEHHMINDLNSKGYGTLGVATFAEKLSILDPNIFQPLHSDIYFDEQERHKSSNKNWIFHRTADRIVVRGFPPEHVTTLSPILPSLVKEELESLQDFKEEQALLFQASIVLQVQSLLSSVPKNI
ncbi:unnamed protein product [Lepeophtheirus salmonis]|uniref:(salmon louse) hypothetical protein n=1 Tax=Lepeophtheirus salmonis TaxID=72036 RepID=A0A7R8GZK8_LEPSM|nr:unnamed protein product [Lepeophtheirus salmonis]CAF2766418.1 unnamed protein product [Lepeophtheirus salmonis]